MKTKEKTSKTDATHSLNSFWNIFGLGLKHFKWFVYLGNTDILRIFSQSELILFPYKMYVIRIKFFFFS